MTIFAGNRQLRLKVTLRGPKVWVNLILNVIGVRLRSTRTHFDHNRYIIRIFILGVFYRSLWSYAKVSDPLYRGVLKIFFHRLLFQFVVSNPFHVLEVGKKIKSKFSNLSLLPTFRGVAKQGADLKGMFSDSNIILWHESEDIYTHTQTHPPRDGATGGGGGQGGNRPPKGFKKRKKIKIWGIFMH